LSTRYLKDLAKRTFRGVEQLALNGLHTGGRVFGYRRVPIESTTERDSHGRAIIAGVKLEVDPDQAPTVRRIFERYAAGYSLKRIALELNQGGVTSPQPQKGRIARSWYPSSVRHILHNERYRGLVIWGKTYKVRSHETGKRIYRRKPKSEWRRKEIPAQRIVSDELWNAVRARMTVVNELYSLELRRPGILRARAVSSPYVFSGLLKCSLWSEHHDRFRLFAETGRCPIRLLAALQPRPRRLQEQSSNRQARARGAAPGRSAGEGASSGSRRVHTQALRGRVAPRG
jgi:site-specific DNA recombinase